MKKAVVLCLAPLLLVLAPPLRAQAPTSHIIQRILVKVNGEIFTQTDLTQRQIEALREKNPQLDSLANLQSDAKLQVAVAEVTPDIIVRVVDELLMVQRGRELGYRLTDERFKTIVEGMKKENKIADDAAFKAALQSSLGMTMEDYRKMIEQQFIYRQVQQDEIMQRATLTEEEARQYFEKHHDEFMTPVTVTLREIFIAVPTVGKGAQATFSAGADDDVKSRITAIRDRAVKGEDYVKLVAEASEAGSKAAAGVVGPISVADLDPSLQKNLAALKPGEIAEPFRTARGYELFKLDARSDSTLKPFGAVRDEISQHVYESRLDGETAKFLEKLRAQALIEWKDDGLKQAYDKRLAELAAAGK